MPQVHVEGAQELRHLLRRIADKDLTKMLRQANKRSAEVVVRKALPSVPVRTCNLKASLRATGSQRGGAAVAGGVRAPYSRPIHWGRKRGNVGSPPGNRRGPNAVQGRPFLYDALQASSDEVVAIYTTEVQKLISSIRERI